MKTLIIMSLIILISFFGNPDNFKNREKINNQVIDTLCIQNPGVHTLLFNSIFQTGKVTGKPVVIFVSYSAIECECAQWIETK